ncbi:MAG: diacylglycerol/lipid kinase family protein [Anaerolineae bacterium]
MPLYKLIVNPLAGKGHAALVAAEVKRVFASLGVVYDYAESLHAGHAIELAQEAVQKGYDVLVAVGGDGTTHEVINGMMNSSESLGCQLAIIPAGSGNDFAAVNRIPTNIAQACQTVVKGQTRRVDIGYISIDDTIQRYFDNTIGIGLTGLVGIETRKTPWLRGIPLYLLALLKTVFIHLKPIHLELQVDGIPSQKTTLMVNVANGQREGGGFMIAPQAKTDDGYLDLLVTDVLPRMQVLGLIPRFMNGTHLGHHAIHVQRANNVTVTSEDKLYFHVDGEILCEYAHRIKIQILPAHLRLITP